MGYNTDFEGQFDITPALKQEDIDFLKKFSDSRRMKRRGLDEKYGVDGEWFVDGSGYRGQAGDESVVDYNQPPSTQPGLWCKWVPTDDGAALEWNGVEKFYDYVEWLKYLIDKYLAPRGYVLNGEVEWKGEESDDLGKILVENNVVTTKQGKVVYE